MNEIDEKEDAEIEDMRTGGLHNKYVMLRKELEKEIEKNPELREDREALIEEILKILNEIE